MRVRALSNTGDMTFGHSAANFLINTPATVAQVVKTRLGLEEGEWFLDITDGTPYATKILGPNRTGTYDPAIQSRIIGSPGVVDIESYASNLSNRKLTVTADIVTIFDSEPVTITVTL